jgi:hypothetical protein
LLPRASSYRIRAFIFQARDLPAGDETGTSDPYVKAFGFVDGKERFSKLRDHERTTKHVNETCYPMWYSTLEFTAEKYEKLDTWM